MDVEALQEFSEFLISKLGSIVGSDDPWHSEPSPKYRGRAQGKLRRTREARRMDKKLKMAQPSVNRAPAPSRWRDRALLSLIWKFPMVARLRNPDGAPAPPYFVTPKTRTLHARVMEVARPRVGGRTHSNEVYFGDFTFPGQGPSISQAQFDLFGGGTAEAQHTHSLISSILALE
ncbi:hypothetical protein PIB30_038274 [Stylosanthes scabra]|uniref:Uncharacterized protein n=1 Tax=Stylosanthes scabra TaxID=79078 RepID=A0ABU6YBA8_9FABA|nr:hypothetical protein [Stylosanthes scabra]